RGAPGETVFYTVAACALGQVLVAMTSRGVCRVILGDNRDALVTQLAGELHAATLVADDAAVRKVANAVVQAASGDASANALPLDVRGTAFQQRVWKELTKIPRGETITYGELARRIGSPRAVRAVGTACGANPAAVVVPCHRVLRGDGALGGYRWGVERKSMLLESERDAISGRSISEPKTASR
ncbi:MAG: methylated-DNA--[protein]-cysteine S-methyltransferase, partial [Gemmatimonas sp.]